jgi:hypothetical protein
MKETKTEIEVLNEISFELALDFSPYDLLTSEQLEKANVYRSESYYFDKSIKLAGYKHIKPVHPNSFYVNVNDINSNDLKLYLTKHIENEQENEMDEMLRIKGGTIVLNSNNLIFNPTCCTDITDFDNWINIEQTEVFKSIWIGHPWVLYKTKNEKIYLTDYIEANGDVTDDSKIKYEISVKDYSSKTEILKKTMYKFEQEVLNCLKEIGIKEYIKVTDCILKGNCEPKF